MKWTLVFLTMLISTSAAAASTICEQEEELWWNLKLAEFVVSADTPVRVGDTVYYSFYLKNVGSEPVKIGKGGVYLKTSDGDTFSFYSGVELDPGKSVYVKSSLKPAKSGELTLNPGVCVLTAKGEFCHDFDTSCRLEVFIECPDGWSCMTEKEASQGSYVQLSEEVCGYQISGFTAALIKTPMYCFREVFTCPDKCYCITTEEAKKNGMLPCGGVDELKFCDYSDGEEKYCYQQEKPDLTISDVWSYESTPGVYLELRALVYNAGHGYAANSTVAFFVDGDYVGEVEIHGLKPGESTVAQLDYRSTCSGGQDVFAAKADYHDEIAESEEDNNYRERAFQCEGAGMPNLKVEDASIQIGSYCRPFSYANSTIVFRVANTGNQTSPQSDGRIYVDGQWAYTFSVDELDPGEEEWYTVSMQRTCSGDEDEIMIVVDPQDQIVESDESDNEQVLAVECVVKPEGSDLVITRIFNETSQVYAVIGGGSVPLKSRIYYEIANVGDSYACSSRTGLYVDGRLYAEDWVDPLAPGESRTEVFPVEYNWRGCSGQSDVFEVRADIGNDVEELNEDNNSLTVTWPCHEFPPPPKPDLTVKRVDVQGSGVSDLTIVVVVKNIGDALSPATDVTIYVNYQELGTLVLPPLNPGETKYLRYSGWTPQWERNRVTACVDMSNKVDEIPNERNNCLDDTFTFGMSCSDSVQNRDEEGVDCGGRYCIPCDRCNLASLPQKFDWRDYVSLPRIRNQGSCGSCWAHSAAGTTETVMITNIGASSSIDLSEQFLMDCGPGSCDGGLHNKALSKIVNEGIPDESCFGYTASDTSCGNKCWDWWKRVSGLIYKGKVSSTVADVKRALICHGPLAVASSGWRHAIVLVGYEDNSQTCMDKYGKPGCWIIRNSWGAWTGWYTCSKDSCGKGTRVWHENGYAYIPYAGHRYSDIVNRAYYVVPADYTLHVEFEEGDGLAAGDVNGDGKAEIVHGDRSDWLAVYSLNDRIRRGSIDFEKWDEVAAGDVDGDGRDEIIHADRDDRIDIYKLDGSIRRIKTFNLDFEGGDDLEAGDVNGDGRDEIIHADRGDWIRVYSMQGTKLAAFHIDFENEDRICVGDVNGDGRDEIVHGDRDDWIRIYNESGSKLAEFHLDFEGRDGLQCGDVNGDGKAEIVHGDRSDWLAVYNMHGNLLKRMRMDFEKGDGFAVADVDGDGKAEIIHGDRGDSVHVVKWDRWWS